MDEVNNFYILLFYSNSIIDYIIIIQTECIISIIIFLIAGRPQFDNEGIAIVLTEQHQLELYRSLMNDQTPIESALLDDLIDHMNAEVVVNNMTDQAGAIEWVC